MDMEIVITAWGLDSYLELRHANQFSAADYKKTIRPDVLLLKGFPEPADFANSKFWSPADYSGAAIIGGFKMKWHNLGDRRIQLRLSVGMMDEAFLLHAYVKTDPKAEARQLAKFKTRLELIRRGQYTECGRLS
jgi:hypothetical protein